METLTDDEARKAAWFHSIEIDGVPITIGRFKEKAPPNYTLFGFYDLISKIDVSGARCLDVGTMDGIASLILKKLGASEVVATDIGERQTFHYARQKSGLDVSYVTDTDLYNITEKVVAPFDLVLMAGVLYHVFDPLYAITVARQLTANGGYAIVETHFLKAETQPIMRFNPGDDDPIDQANFFWRASAPCLEAMFSLCSFEVVAKRPIGKRITYLLKAVQPSRMKQVNQMTAKIHRNFMAYRHYRENIDFSALEQGDVTTNVKVADDLAFEATIDIRKFRPTVPFQPKQ